MQNKFKEAGRSMVEMLGVLAVIGVLSVSGILGYKFAMNKYIANETINELNIRASAISHHMEQYIENNYAGDIPMEMGPVMRMGYPITARMHPQYVDYFEMFVSEVPSEICKLLLQSQWQAPYSIFIGTTQYESSVDICTQAEKVELAYEFHKDLLPEAEIEEKDRHEIMRCRHSKDCNCGTCNTETGLCETNCLDNEKCVKDYSEPEWMICCRKSNIVGSYCCASVTEDGKCCDWDGNCCPADKPLKDDKGRCYSCDDPISITVARNSTCNIVCPKRFINNSASKRCILCGVAGTKFADKPLYDWAGNCYACDYEGGFDMGSHLNATHWKKCAETCEDRYAVKNMCNPKCPDDSPLTGVDGACYDCNYSGKALSTPCSDVCSNRTLKDGYCVRTKCLTGTFADKNGTCQMCNIQSIIETSEDNCKSCLNRSYKDGYCYPPVES